jgi:hypothetical protein
VKKPAKVPGRASAANENVPVSAEDLKIDIVNDDLHLDGGDDKTPHSQAASSTHSHPPRNSVAGGSVTTTTGSSANDGGKARASASKPKKLPRAKVKDPHPIHHDASNADFDDEFDQADKFHDHDIEST